MKTKQIIIISLLVIAVIAILWVAPLAWLFTSGLREPARVALPEYWPTLEWQNRTPEELGFDSSRLAEMILTLQENKSGIHSLLIVHKGYVVLNAHFAPYDGTFPHDLASVTKSVMAILIGIAVDQGTIDLDQPVVAYFPDRTIANLDDRKQRMTVRHLLENTSGMESGCVEGDEETLDIMRSYPDWVQAALDRPMVAEPGEKFCYDSPGFHLLSTILQEETGMNALEFARQNLFEPLGIHRVVWETDPQGRARGWGDLHLLPEDAAKIGYLFLHRGAWDGKQIVTEGWVLKSVQAHSRFVGDDYGYGYGWWVSPVGYYATGREGQNIRVFASLNTMVITTGGGFDFTEIESFLTPILLQLKGSRPASPQGMAALVAALTAIQQEEIAPVVAPSPSLLKTVSGTRYLCESNPAAIEDVQLDFNDPKQAALSFRIGDVTRDWPIGLDGEYLFTPEGAAARGSWIDEQTFQFILFDVGMVTHTLIFEKDHLRILLPELDLTILCRMQRP